jgi:hypothetical protein
LEAGDIHSSHKVVSGKLFGTAAEPRALMIMLLVPCGVQTPPEIDRSKQPEVDFVNAMKRFLVRADVYDKM